MIFYSTAFSHGGLSFIWSFPVCFLKWPPALNHAICRPRGLLPRCHFTIHAVQTTNSISIQKYVTWAKHKITCLFWFSNPFYLPSGYMRYLACCFYTGVFGKREVDTGFLWESLRDRNNLGDLGMYGKIILK